MNKFRVHTIAVAIGLVFSAGHGCAGGLGGFVIGSDAILGGLVVGFRQALRGRAGTEHEADRNRNRVDTELVHGRSLNF